jgi:hypothetical protein
MDEDKRRQEQVRSIQEKAIGTYSTKYLTGLIENACEIIQIMKRAGYTKQEICYIFGIGKAPYGKKEQLLLVALQTGRVQPTDRLQTIKEKMAPDLKLSRQSWAIAFNRLIENGDLG